MNKSSLYLTALVAGMMAAGASFAQSAPAAGSTDGPPKAGEASNQTQGVPNAKTTNSPFTEKPVISRDAVRQDAQGLGTASATTSVPAKAGEATTMVQGRPNADLKPMPMTREQVVGELLQRRSLYYAGLRNPGSVRVY